LTDKINAYVIFKLFGFLKNALWFLTNNPFFPKTAHFKSFKKRKKSEKKEFEPNKKSRKKLKGKIKVKQKKV